MRVEWGRKGAVVSGTAYIALSCELVSRAISPLLVLLTASSLNISAGLWSQPDVLGIH